jgi:hypothetical protein
VTSCPWFSNQQGISVILVRASLFGHVENLLVERGYAIAEEARFGVRHSGYFGMEFVCYFEGLEI